VISLFQAAILGLIQGLTELFPISSLGHSVIIPKLLGWDIPQNSSYFLTFLVATHLATATVLFVFFLPEWKRIFRGLGRSFAQREVKTSDTYAKLGWLLVVGTIPAGIIGLLLQDHIRNLFNSAEIAASFLMVNGLILLGAEKLRKNRASAAHQTSLQSDEHVAKLSWSSAVFVGTAQAAALIPGISRSGSSMAGGLLAGLDNEAAARFSFLLATPVIGAAAVLKLPELFSSDASGLRGAALVGAIFAAAAAYFSVKFLTKYFKTSNLKPFGYYCILAGLTSLILLALK